MSETPIPLEKPLRITVGNLKGGTGRSTTSMFLAFGLARRTGQPVLVVDADGANGTAYEWQEAVGESWPAGIKVVYWPSKVLAKRVEDYPHTGHVIIDTSPFDADVLRQALTVTDHLIVPIAATPGEAGRLTPTLRVAAETENPLELTILFTRITRRTLVLSAARAALADMGLRVFDADVPFKLMYSQATNTVIGDLGDYDDVLDEILRGQSK